MTKSSRCLEHLANKPMMWYKLLLIDTECLDNKKDVWNGFSDEGSRSTSSYWNVSQAELKCCTCWFVNKGLGGLSRERGSNSLVKTELTAFITEELF